MGVMEGLQPGFCSGRLLLDSLPYFFCPIPQQSPQKFPTWVLRNNVDELDPTDQVLVRRLRFRDVLTNGNETRQYRFSHL